MKNVKLKLALYEKGITQSELSKKTKIPSSYISLAISGRLNLTSAEEKQIADTLNMKVLELF